MIQDVHIGALWGNETPALWSSVKSNVVTDAGVVLTRSESDTAGQRGALRWDGFDVGIGARRASGSTLTSSIARVRRGAALTSAAGPRGGSKMRPNSP